MKQDKAFYIVGRNSVREALLKGTRINSLLIDQRQLTDTKIQEIVSLARKQHLEVRTVSSDFLSGLVDGQNAQGIAAIFEIDSELTLRTLVAADKDQTFLLFNGFDYEQNLGAILRTAWATNVTAIVVNPSGVRELTPVVAKVSMGGAAFVPVFFQSLFPALGLIQAAAIPIYGVEAELGEVFNQTDLRGPKAFVFGSEAKSISDPLKKYCNKLINIPMANGLASLNISVATALVLYEKLRQSSLN